MQVKNLIIKKEPQNFIKVPISIFNHKVLKSVIIVTVLALKPLTLDQTSHFFLQSQTLKESFPKNTLEQLVKYLHTPFLNSIHYTAQKT